MAAREGVIAVGERVEGPVGRDAAQGGIALRDVVADVVANVAPAESPLVAALQRFDDETVLGKLKASGGRDEPLGFGFEADGPLVLSVVWIAMDETVRRIVGPPVERALRGRRWWPWRRARAAQVTVPALSGDQLSSVWRNVVEAGERAGLSPKRSTEIADSTVARLTMNGPRPVAQGAAGEPEAVEAVEAGEQEEREPRQ